MEEEQDIQSDIVKRDQLLDSQKNKEFDDAVAGGTLEDLREGVKIRQREKRQTGLDLKAEIAGVGFETSVNVATDALTTALGWAPPLYAVVNFLSAGGANLVSQKVIRGKEDIDWGEAWASAGLGTIPFMSPSAGRLTKVVGNPNSIKRAVVGGGLTGVGYQQIEAGINERRVISPTEAALGFATGGAVSGTFKGATDTGQRLLEQIRGAMPFGSMSYGLAGQDLRTDFSSPFKSSSKISNLGGRGFKETSELTRAGIHPSHHKGDKLYNYPEIPEGGEFLWYGKKDVDVPTPKGVPVDLGDGLIASKNDIDLSTFDLSDPTKVSKQFEDLLRQSLEIDQIGMKHLSHIGQKRSKVIEGQTGEQTVGLMWNDYLAGYFNKFIRSGKATNFDEAVRVKLPNGRVLKGDSTLARELRLWTIKPEVISTGFTKGGTAPSSRQYQRDLARIVNNHNPGQDPNFSNKFHAHHINVIEEEWPLVRGLNSPELIKMRKLLAKYIKYPSGNEIGNRLIVLDEIHNKIHADYWPQYAAEFREIVNDPNFNTLYPTAADREELVIMFGEIVEKMMNEAILPDIDDAIRKAHLKYKFRINDDNVTDYVDEILDEIEFERSKSIESGFADDFYERPFSKEELEAGQGITDDPFK